MAVPSSSRRRFLVASSTVLGGLLASSRRAWPRTTGPCQSPDRDRFLDAVRAGDTAAVSAFLDGDPGLAACRDDRGCSAFVLAHLQGHAEVAALLAATGLDLDLLEASLAGDWDRLGQLALANPGEVDAIRPPGGTALYVMAGLGSADLWRLQSLGADPNLVPETGAGMSAVHAAFTVLDLRTAVATATDLLGNGGRAGVLQHDGDSLLHAAVLRDSVALARLALRKGADPAARDARGETALQRANRLGRTSVVEVFEHPERIAKDHRSSRFAYDASGSRYQAADRDGLDPTLAQRIVGVSHGNQAQVEELLAMDPRYAQSISYVDEAAVEASAHTGRVPIARRLLDAGAPLSLPTCLTMGELGRARELLEEDPLRVNERGAHDFALLWYVAIGGGDPDALTLLLEHGADVDQESQGTTALHWAALSGQIELAEALLEEGANLEAIGTKFDRSGQTPLQLARQRGQQDMVRFLESQSGV